MRTSTLIRDRDGSSRRMQCSTERSREVLGVSQGLLTEPSRTLEDLMVETWAGLQADGPTACPMCDSVMEPRWSAGAGVVGGRCRQCGTEMA